MKNHCSGWLAKYWPIFGYSDLNADHPIAVGGCRSAGEQKAVVLECGQECERVIDHSRGVSGKGC
jgi:hypothetical protein